MCDDLVEPVASAIAKVQCEDDDRPVEDWRHWGDEARAALASIEAAGYVVVPREPTREMRIRGGIAWAKAYTTYPDAAGACFQAVIQAALEKDQANVG